MFDTLQKPKQLVRNLPEDMQLWEQANDAVWQRFATRAIMLFSVKT